MEQNSRREREIMKGVIHPAGRAAAEQTGREPCVQWHMRGDETPRAEHTRMRRIQARRTIGAYTVEPKRKVESS